MARFKITAPDGRFEGIVGGARFIEGTATVPEGHPALGYCQRRGYTVEPAGGQASASSAPVRPADADRKAAWVAYVAATSDLSEAEANDMTKSELIALADS